MKKRGVKVNYIFQSGYQILNLIMPLITTPYISRRLQAEGIGAFSYTYSIICYLIIFSNLGINAYASRKVSVLQELPGKQKIFFWQIIGIKLINSIIPGIIYFLLVLFDIKYSLLFLSELFFWVSGFINITWFFSGMEDFQSTVRNNVIAKVIGIIMLFILVKDEGDTVVYALIMGGTIFLGDILQWRSLPEYIRKGRPQISEYKKHFKGGIKMLMPELASSVFTYGDKVMLGILMISTIQNGYYEQAQKVIILSQGVINSIATVMLPRIVHLYSKDDKAMISYYMNKTMHFLLIIAVPLSFGISGVAKDFVPWFFGSGYETVETLLYILSPIIFVHGVYYILGYQYLFGTNQEVRFTVYILVGAIVNTILNFGLIPVYGAVGACMASVISEVVISIVLLFNARQIINIRKMVKNGGKPLMSSIIMLLLLKQIEIRMDSTFISTFVQIIAGIIIYGIMMVLLKDSFVMNEMNRIYAAIVTYGFGRKD